MNRVHHRIPVTLTLSHSDIMCMYTQMHTQADKNEGGAARKETVFNEYSLLCELLVLAQIRGQETL